MQRRRRPCCRRQVVLTRPLEDRAVDVAAAAAAGNLSAQVAKLRLDVGWSLWAQGAVRDEEEEEEDTQLEFTLAGGCCRAAGRALVSQWLLNGCWSVACMHGWQGRR
jgi:hypothetical protein